MQRTNVGDDVHQLRIGQRRVAALGRHIDAGRVIPVSYTHLKDGRLSNEARGSLIGSLILFFITAVFIFGWSWGAIWPVFLIIGGIGALLSGLFN